MSLIENPNFQTDVFNLHLRNQCYFFMFDIIEKQ